MRLYYLCNSIFLQKFLGKGGSGLRPTEFRDLAHKLWCNRFGFIGYTGRTLDSSCKYADRVLGSGLGSCMSSITRTLQVFAIPKLRKCPGLDEIWGEEGTGKDALGPKADGQ